MDGLDWVGGWQVRKNKGVCRKIRGGRGGGVHKDEHVLSGSSFSERCKNWSKDFLIAQYNRISWSF